MGMICSGELEVHTDQELHPGLRTALDLAREFGALLATAEALTRAGRAVDLSGMEGLCGRLCAAALDLPPDLGRCLGPNLAHLLEQAEQLILVLDLARGPTP
jgi:hypothetical protein